MIISKLSLFFTTAYLFTLLITGVHAQAQVSQEITNSIGIKLILIPKGVFTMGSSPSEAGRVDDEEQHQVTISQDYYLGAMEVTQGQYLKVMKTNPSYFQKRSIGGSDSSMYPVDSVSWEDAMDFCKGLSELPEEKKAGRVYRLPTEAEWEYACRAGSKSTFSSGDSADSLASSAWFGNNSNGRTHPVGEKKANAWGLYDMHGNVWEWCSDWYGTYPTKAITDPIGTDKGYYIVSRGGCWHCGVTYCRSARRFWNYPTGLGYYYGFRLALSPPDVSK